MRILEENMCNHFVMSLDAITPLKCGNCTNKYLMMPNTNSKINFGCVFTLEPRYLLESWFLQCGLVG